MDSNKDGKNYKYIYVFSDDDKRKLIEMHYGLLKEDYQKNFYIFLNNGIANFDRDNIKFALSNTLTF